MKKQSVNTEQLLDAACDYLDAKEALLRLRMAEQTANMMAAVATSYIILPVLLLILLLSAITFALAIDQRYGGSTTAFYVVMGLVYIVAGLLLVKYRNRWITGPLTNSIIRQLTQQHAS